MAAGWLHKVRTGSGSDRVVSEMLNYAGHFKSLALFKRLCMRFDPVATAPGSDFVWPLGGDIVTFRVFT